MKTTYEERKIMTESPDSVLLESALQTLKMIASAKRFKDEFGFDTIMGTYQDLATKEVALIEQKQKEYRRYLIFGENDNDHE